MALTRTAVTETLKTDEEMLAIWQRAEVDIAKTGQNYTIFGGRIVTRADLPEIRKQIAFYTRRVLAAKGATGRTIADLSGSTSSGQRSNNLADDY